MKAKIVSQKRQVAIEVETPVNVGRIHQNQLVLEVL
jgi:hypothetical protein